MPDPRPTNAERVAAAAFRALLRLYPRAFRKTFAPEMSAVFADVLTDARQRGLKAGLSVAARELAGLPCHALRQYLQPATKLTKGLEMDMTACNRCDFVSPPGARYCAECGRAFIADRERISGWLDARPLPVGFVLAAAFLCTVVWASRTITEAGLFFRGSYVLWLLAIIVGAIYFGRVIRRPLTLARKAGRLMVVLATMVVAVGGIRALDHLVVTQMVDLGWRNALVLPGIELTATKLEAADDAATLVRARHYGAMSSGHRPHFVATAIRAAEDGYTVSVLQARSVDAWYLLATFALMASAAALGRRPTGPSSPAT